VARRARSAGRGITVAAAVTAASFEGGGHPAALVTASEQDERGKREENRQACDNRNDRENEDSCGRGTPLAIDQHGGREVT
jgi:hypothetical protein